MGVPSFLRGIPAHGINGVTVAAGIVLVQAIAGTLGGTSAALIASSGAVFASLPDTPLVPVRTRRRVLAGGVIGCVTSLLIAALAAHPIALGVATIAIGFASSLMLAWGLRAAAISFVPLLALVFTMAAPPLHGAAAMMVHAGWTAFGAALYLGWASLVTRLLQPRYRSLALARALDATGQLLRSRAERLDIDPRDAQVELPLQVWIERQAVLDERLQAARDLLFAAPQAAGVPLRITLLLHAIELRDALLAGELDLDLLGHDAAGARLREALGRALHRHAAAMQAIADALRAGETRLPAWTRTDTEATLKSLAELRAADTGDTSAGRLRQSLLRRAAQMTQDVAAMQSLLHEADDARPPSVPLGIAELQLFVSPEGWPLATLRAQWHVDSPVMRHALRSALALGGAYFLARTLPWASHPHWLVLSVAVVLRGNLFQTLARRNDRIAGSCSAARSCSRSRRSSCRGWRVPCSCSRSVSRTPSSRPATWSPPPQPR